MIPIDIGALGTVYKVLGENGGTGDETKNRNPSNNRTVEIDQNT